MSRKELAIAHVIESHGYRPDFCGWVFANWKIYEEFERLAMVAIKRGRARLSAKFLFEMVRWNTALREDGAFKLNGNFTADCARLCAHLNPEAEGMFEFRARQKVLA